MWMYALIPFCIQGVAITFDEMYFHHKRGLPTWERIGHPIDTLSLLICILMVVFVPFSANSLKIYLGLSVLSCLMVTKDEFVHKHHCCASENWLHALLFILHPITLCVAGMMWPVIQGVTVPFWMSTWLDNAVALKQFIHMQAFTIFLFFLYQVVFWNIIWRKSPVLKNE
jgi:hypothetical protein